MTITNDNEKNNDDDDDEHNDDDWIYFWRFWIFLIFFGNFQKFRVLISKVGRMFKCFDIWGVCCSRMKISWVVCSFCESSCKSPTQMLAAHTPTSTLLGTFQAEAAWAPTPPLPPSPPALDTATAIPTAAASSTVGQKKTVISIRSADPQPRCIRISTFAWKVLICAFAVLWNPTRLFHKSTIDFQSISVPSAAPHSGPALRLGDRRSPGLQLLRRPLLLRTMLFQLCLLLRSGCRD